MIRKTTYLLLTIIVILNLVGCIVVRKFEKNFFKDKTNHFEYTSEPKTIHFLWAKDSIGNYYETKAGIVIPFDIEGFDFHFYMQFDTGAPHSYIYEKDLISLQKMGLNIKLIEIDDAKYVEQLNFVLDSNHIEAKMIKVLQGFGHTFDKNDTSKSFVLGTIGSDFMVNRITSINFKKQDIFLYDKRPDWMEGLSGFNSFDFTGRRIMIPVTLGGEAYEFFYDTGCSPFGLITTKKRFNEYTDKDEEAIKYNAKSWGNGLPMVNKASNKSFKIGNTELKLKRVSYLAKYTIFQPLAASYARIGGWLGNQAFTESTLIFDTKSDEFIILEQKQD